MKTIEARAFVTRPTKSEIRDREVAELVKNQRGRLLSFINRQVRDRFEAEDVFQDVITEYLEAYDLGEAIESLSSWLVRVAQNKIVDRFRRKKIRTDYQESLIEQPSEDSGERPDDEWERAWLRTEILEGLSLLPDDQREVFVKHELEGKSFEEISTETGVGVSTLLSRKRYAVLFLREYLKEIYDEYE